MSQVRLDSKLYQIVLADPTIVTVLNRFGIEMGVGDHTVASVCASKGIEPEFFITMLNTYLSPNYFPEQQMSTFNASAIIAFLEQTNTDYERLRIPNVERHFAMLLQQGTDKNSNLELMMRFFVEVKTELLQRIDDDRTRWFPQILKLAQNSSATAPVPRIDEESDSVEDKIDDLISMFVIHLKGSYDLNLCQAVLVALTSLKKDIKQNNRIRNRILRPLSLMLLK